MIPIIIPAYEPDQRLIGLLKDLSEYTYGPVILVNDGSGSAYENIFKTAKNLLSEKVILLTHEVIREILSSASVPLTRKIFPGKAVLATVLQKRYLPMWQVFTSVIPRQDFVVFQENL